MVKLEYDNIVLRRWRTSDKEQLAKIANNRKISDNLKDSFPYPYSIDDAKKILFVYNNMMILFPKFSPSKLIIKLLAV